MDIEKELPPKPSLGSLKNVNLTTLRVPLRLYDISGRVSPEKSDIGPALPKGKSMLLIWPR